MDIPNYLDLLVDEENNTLPQSQICIEGISHIVANIYKEIKDMQSSASLSIMKQKFELGNLGSWQKGTDPIPIVKLKNLLMVWKKICKKSEKDTKELYELVYQEAFCLTAQKSPHKILAIKNIDQKLAYLLGVIFADGALRNSMLVFNNKGRMNYEITITDESAENISSIVKILESVFGVKTNVKAVYNGRWYRILFSSIVLHRILNKLFQMPYGYKKGKLRMPELIKNCPWAIKKYFIIGFFDGDGHCTHMSPVRKYPIVTVSQSSKAILQDLQRELNMHGFLFRLYKKSRRGHTWYSLGIKKREQIKKFENELGFNYANKKQKLRTLIEETEDKKIMVTMT